MIRPRLLCLASSLLGILALTVAVTTPPGHAQTYPTANPTYIPQALLASQTLTATGNTTTFNVNGVETLYMRVGGTFSALTATVQGSETRAGTPTWTSLPAVLVGGSRRLSVAGTGLYRVNVSGLAAIRVNVSVLTGTDVTFAFSGGSGTVLAAVPATYSASAVGVTTAASATDIVTITGSASATIHVNRMTCSGTSTAIGAGLLNVVRRSTANSAGTSAALTAVTHDTTNPTASATLLSYTANPTLGTTVGTIRTAVLNTTPTGTTTYFAGPLVFDFSGSPIVLRGTTQVLAINGNGASLPGGTALSCSVEWSEQ
jgi:hypothetical protein